VCGDARAEAALYHSLHNWIEGVNFYDRDLAPDGVHESAASAKCTVTLARDRCGSLCSVGHVISLNLFWVAAHMVCAGSTLHVHVVVTLIWQVGQTLVVRKTY